MPHHSTLSLHKEDIPALSAFFLGRFAAGRNLSLSPEATRLLAGYAWPGNIRELRNALEYARHRLLRQDDPAAPPAPDHPPSRRRAH